jgi:hypothetical protein
MPCRRIFSVVLGLALFVFAGAVPALATTAPSQDSLAISHASAQNTYDSGLTVHFDKPMSAATAAQVKAALTQRMAAPESTVAPLAAGPSGAFLYCNVLYRFSDADGTFSFQHKCGGTTGPWGYKLSAGLCAITISEVHEPGMEWVRNGKKQGRQHDHNYPCTEQFHGTFNPDHDYDFISYSDSFTFRIDVGGQTGSADVTIHGSFTSAGCANRIACGP